MELFASSRLPRPHLLMPSSTNSLMACRPESPCSRGLPIQHPSNRRIRSPFRSCLKTKNHGKSLLQVSRLMLQPRWETKKGRVSSSHLRSVLSIPQAEIQRLPRVGRRYSHRDSITYVLILIDFKGKKDKDDASASETVPEDKAKLFYRQLEEKYHCSEHNRPCAVLSEGNHYHLTDANLAKWAWLIVSLFLHYTYGH